MARPDLARQIAAARAGEEVVEMTWAEMQPMLREFWTQSVAQLTEKQAPGRLKQWLAMLTRNYPQAVELFTALRREMVKECVHPFTHLVFQADGTVQCKFCMKNFQVLNNGK